MTFTGRHADPGVTHLETNPLRFHGGFGFHADRHLTGGSELHGISGEINEHLAEASGIAKKTRWHARFDEAEELQLFLLSLNGHEICHSLDYLPQVESRFLQFHLVSLHLGEVEQV